MRAGDLVLVKGDGLIPWLIRVTSGSKWNHVEIFVGNGMCVSAELSIGVVERTLRHIVSKAREACVVRVVTADNEAARRVANRARDLVGRRYDVGGTLGILFKLLCVRLGLSFIVFWGKNKASADQAFFCSELVAALYMERGIEIVKADPSYVSPADIAESRMVARLEVLV